MKKEKQKNKKKINRANSLGSFELSWVKWRHTHLKGVRSWNFGKIAQVSFELSVFSVFQAMCETCMKTTRKSFLKKAVCSWKTHTQRSSTAFFCCCCCFCLLFYYCFVMLLMSLEWNEQEGIAFLGVVLSFLSSLTTHFSNTQNTAHNKYLRIEITQ